MILVGVGYCQDYVICISFFRRYVIFEIEKYISNLHYQIFAIIFSTCNKDSATIYTQWILKWTRCLYNLYSCWWWCDEQQHGLSTKIIGLICKFLDKLFTAQQASIFMSSIYWIFLLLNSWFLLKIISFLRWWFFTFFVTYLIFYIIFRRHHGILHLNIFHKISTLNLSLTCPRYIWDMCQKCPWDRELS